MSNPFAGQTVSGTFNTSPGTVQAKPANTPPLVDLRTVGPTAMSAHNMIKAFGIEAGFVVGATMLAGVSDSWGSSMVALMLALLVLRGLFEVDIFTAFASGLALTPGVPAYNPANFTGGGGGQFSGTGASGGF